MPDDRPARPHGRRIEDFETEGGLLPAEAKLRESVRLGERCELGSERPEQPTDDNRIRASFLRFLALGGDAETPVHERGVELMGAYIDGNLDLGSCTNVRPLLLALCHFPGQIILRDARTHKVNLTGSRIDGLKGDRAQIAGELFMHQANNTPFHAVGEIRLLAADIRGNLTCRGGWFANPKGGALTCDGIKVSGDVVLDNGFFAKGEVRLLGAEIGGDLNCCGGRFTHVEGNALNCNGIKVVGNVFLKNGFNADGAIRLVGADIGGNLEGRGGRFANPKSKALDCDRIKVLGNVAINSDFSAEGEVRLLGAEIGGVLNCYGGRFYNAQPLDEDSQDCDYAITLQGARIIQALILGPIAGAEEQEAGICGSVNLEGAHAALLIDLTGAWPPKTVAGPNGKALACHILLDGFTYDRLYLPGKADERIAWLHRQRPRDLCEDFKPQPFEQLARVLRAMGHDGDAQWLAIEKRRLELRRPWPNPWTFRRNPLRWMAKWLPNAAIYALKWLFLEKLIGYGYRPHRAVVTALALWVLTSWFFYQVAAGGGMAPSDPRVFLNADLVAACADNWATCTHPRMMQEHTPFQPAFYALDVILPVAPLGQESAWAPKATVWRLDLPWVGWVWVSGWVSLIVTWFNVLFGWVVGLLLAGVVGGVIKQE